VPNFAESEQLVRNVEVFSGKDELFAKGKMHEVKNKSGLVYKV